MRDRAGIEAAGRTRRLAFLWTTRAELEMLVHDVDPQVLEAFIALY